MTDDAPLRQLMDAIAFGDDAAALALLAATPALARATLQAGATRTTAADHFLTGIHHYIYVGDTALHVAAAGHRPVMAKALLAAGADIDARNRRGAAPLHYAAEGHPGASGWDPDRQAAVVTLLIAAGADPNAVDRDGVAPLHRAVRTRSAAAVDALLEGGADPRRANGKGSTPLSLALQTTGRSGSGSPEARAQQAAIIARLDR